ncbi:hypothetical protein APHAL10511_000511 [Amanita phalloides]|nr:hypothetical protein APHAL10511_000511 [Amanita phalloides]
MAGSGSGSSLPTPVLVLSGVCTLVAVLVSAVSIYLQLKSYRKPLLQRMVARIMIMIPIYAIASLISLFSLEAAFVIDAIRDIYEAFVIYCFFSLLLTYLGGERSLLILLHGRPPKSPPFPVSIFKRELDVSDPHTFLFLKRGIIQYVQVKPVLAVATLVLKAFGWYNEGDFRANSGYLYVSIVYNVSICLALYCLAMFWLCVNDDLKPYRPVPKFLCVKGILFFSFWQSIAISTLVAADVITRLGPYTDPEHISLGLTDTLICIEMPFFSLAHLYAFNYTDYIDLNLHFCARMPIRYAFMDAFGIKDVVEDIKATLRGKGMDYREFEPAEGEMHQGAGRARRIKAGLRYSKGGKKKYWLPEARADAIDVHAPLLGRQADDAVVHFAPDMVPGHGGHEDPMVWDPINGTGDGGDDGDGYELPFGELDPADEDLFNHSRRYLFGDYNYPVLDVSDEDARVAVWHEEERVLRDERGAWQSPIRNVQVGIQGKVWEGYGAVRTTEAIRDLDPSISRGGKGMGEHPQTSEAPLRWQDADKGLLVPGVRRVRTSSAPSSAASSTSSGDPSRGTVYHRTSPAASKTSLASTLSPSLKLDEKSKTKGKAKGKGKHLPSDAIDLVVENCEAGSKEQRRAGESSLKKVYRREPTLDNGGAVEEVQIHVRPADEQVEESDRGEDDGQVSVWGNDGVYRTRSAQEGKTITRLGTPPSHVRMAYDELEDDNPWA